MSRNSAKSYYRTETVKGHQLKYLDHAPTQTDVRLGYEAGPYSRAFSVQRMVNPAIYINDSVDGVEYTKLIRERKKTIETRFNTTLDGFIGKRVAIIRTGKGKAKIVAYATITGRYTIDSEKAFQDMADMHYVPEKTDNAIKSSGKHSVKYGYVLENVRSIAPIPASDYLVAQSSPAPRTCMELTISEDEAVAASSVTEGASLMPFERYSLPGYSSERTNWSEEISDPIYRRVLPRCSMRSKNRSQTAEHLFGRSRSCIRNTRKLISWGGIRKQ